MRVRLSLFAKILLWFFVNVAVLGGVLFAIFRLQFRLPPESALFAGNRLDVVAGRISDELREAAPEDRTGILRRYADTHRVEFLLFAHDGAQLAGPVTQLPAEVAGFLHDRPPPPPPRPPAGRPRSWDRRRPAPQAQPMFTVKTSNPTRYWAGVRLPVFEPGVPRPTLATLITASDSISGHGLYFDVRPWLFVVTVVLVLSGLLWLPFVRGLTATIREMTRATELIAEERFDARVTTNRSDELGRLGAAINQMAARLEGFVGGQKRFLGDISHELNSPLGRLEVALSILEESVPPAARNYVGDAQEDVRLMTQLVTELLAFARAGMKTQAIELVPVVLRPLIDRVRAREAARCDIIVEASDTLAALGRPELLSRALANVIRNAVRYAGEAGPITVSARRERSQILLSVADRGPGVPPESLGRLFDPFYRPEPDRARATGGSGLGLAIVKTCVEACGGTVAARNLEPAGFEVTMVLRAEHG